MKTKTTNLIYGMIIGSISTSLFIIGLLVFPLTQDIIMNLLFLINDYGILLIFIATILFICGIYYNE